MSAFANLDSLRITLQAIVKPELNKLYTESPKFGVGDSDWGWYCKEHALHCYFLAKLMGFTATIRRGDFIGRNPVNVNHEWDGISSVESDSDHMWCEIDEVVPVDLSVNYEYFEGSFPWIDIVFGTGDYGGSTILYFNDPALFVAHSQEPVNRSVLAYLEKDVVAFDDVALLSDPYQLLFQPETHGIGSTYGHDIFNKVTLHLFDLAIGKTDRLLKRSRNIPEALGVIRSRFPNPSETILERLATAARSLR